ncbi:MAG: hemerythrin domain-containing protein [Polyangiales bacterium]
MVSRYDMYNNVHKGLRRSLCALLVDAGVASERELPELRSRWLALEAKLAAHHAHEDRFIGPHLARIAPPLFAEMERDHHAIAQQLATVGASDDARAFYRTLSSFVASYLAHMAQEEGAYNDALQGAYTDRDLMAIEGELVGSIAPPLLGEFMAMMLPAMNLDERFDLLAGMRAGAPPEVFAGMCQLASQVLEPHAWGQLEARLG